MPDPNNPTTDPTPEAPEPLTAEQEARDGQEVQRAEAGEAPEAADAPEAPQSSIQDTMEDALNASLAAAEGAGDTNAPLRTYPITAKMRERLLNEFTYHTPRQDQSPRYAALRSMALTFATMVVELTPPSREQSLALTKIGETIMHANAAIARGEGVAF